MGQKTPDSPGSSAQPACGREVKTPSCDKPISDREGRRAPAPAWGSPGAQAGQREANEALGGVAEAGPELGSGF